MSTPASGDKTPPYSKAKLPARDADRAGFKLPNTPTPGTSSKAASATPGPSHVTPDPFDATPDKGKQVTASGGGASGDAGAHQRKVDEYKVNKMSRKDLINVSCDALGAIRLKNDQIAKLKATNSELQRRDTELTAANESLAASNDSLTIDCTALKKLLDKEKFMSKQAAQISALENQVFAASRNMAKADTALDKLMKPNKVDVNSYRPI